jgi:hypothetical protein
MYHTGSFLDQYEDFKDLGAEVIELAVTASSPIKNSQNNINCLLFIQMLIRKSEAFGVPCGMFGLLPGG